MECNACVCYFTDWLNQDLHPNHMLFNVMNRKNLAKAMPAIIPFMYKFITSLKDDVKNHIYFLLNQNLLNLTYEESKDLVLRNSYMWIKMKQICHLYSMEEIGAIQAIMEDAFISKGIYIDQWIGYCLINLLSCVKDIHMEHSGALRMLEMLQDNGFSSHSNEKADADISVVKFDELYD